MAGNKSEKRVMILVISYLVYVFCYGIVIKLTIFNATIFQIKTIVPELIICAVIGYCAVHGLKEFKRIYVLLIIHLFSVFVINYTLHGFNSYIIRDLYLPLILFIALTSTFFSEESIDYFFSKMIIFAKLYLILGLILAIVEQKMGWQWTSVFYTGYQFYGQDPYSKIKIAHNIGMVRAPSLSGNFATFGYYCLICNVIVLSREKKFKKRMIWNIITVLCIVLATNKSAFIAFCVYLMLEETLNIRKKNSKINALIIIIMIFVALFSMLWLTGESSGAATYNGGLLERLNIWKELVSEANYLEILFPFNQFIYSSGTSGTLGFWDNSYLYSLFSIGVIGVLLGSFSVSEIYKRIRISNNEYIVFVANYLLVLLLVLGLTVNITQGRGFLTIFLLIIGVFSSSNYNVHEEKSNSENYKLNDS